MEQFVIHKYLPVPFKHQGRDMQGLDCYGLVIAIYADLGIKLFDIEEDYSVDWSFKGKNIFLENAYKDFIEIDKPVLYDLVAFKSKNGVMNHLGIMLDENRFINACKAGVVVCRVNEGIWIKRFAGFYRHKGLINDKN